MLTPMAISDRPIDAALAANFGQLRQSLLNFLRRYVGDTEAAEDVLQNVMVKALTTRSNSVPDNLAAWLMTIARNAATDYLRARRPTEELPAELAAEETGEPDEELVSCLRPLAERLPKPYRDAVVAAEFAGVALASLAKQEQVSLSAIKSRTSRGRVMLRDELIRCCQVALASDGSGLDYDARKLRACGSPSETTQTCPSCQEKS
jgi:RNA polymerase sigma-70 factor (ECF subfamily)